MMKKFLIYTLSIAFVLGVCSCDGSKKSVTLDSASDSLSYGIGVMQGSRLADAKDMGIYPELNELDVELYIKGVKEGVKVENSSYYQGLNSGIQMKANLEKMSEQFGANLDVETFVVAYVQSLLKDSVLAISKADANVVCDSIVAVLQAAKEQAMLDSIAKTPEAIANDELGREFLAAKEKEQGVQKTESGLLYKVIKEGKGEKFKATDRIELSYVGKFITDSVFEKNDNAKFVASQMIPGFREGLQLMSPGAKYILYIPSELAYGLRGQNGIPANSTLVFEIETKGVASATPVRPRMR